MKDLNDREMETTISDAFDAAARPVVTVDVERYQAYLDSSDMTPDQKRAFLEALWSIITAFVDLGFGVHPLQEVCGQIPESPDQSTTEEFNTVGSDREIAGAGPASPVQTIEREAE